MREASRSAKGIIHEAQRIAAERGIAAPDAYQRREILRLARGWIDEGTPWVEAARGAAVIVLRLHAVEDAPWK